MSEARSVNSASAFRRQVQLGVLAELRQTGGATRGELMATLGLSRTALTRVLAGLFDDALIVEEPSREGQQGAGRPARIVRATRASRRTLALRVTSDAVTVAVVDQDGVVLERLDHEVPLAAGLPAVVRILEASAERFLQSSTEPPPTRLVAILPTMVSGAGTAVTAAGAIELMPSWVRPQTRERLQRAARLPATLRNDGQLAALAESHVGSARGARNVLLIVPGANGIAGGLVVDGRLHLGAGAAGEISHIMVSPDGEPCPCGRRGCLAAEVRRIAREYRRSHGLDLLDRDELDADPDDPGYRAVVTEIAELLARVAGGMVNVLHPEIVVLADRLTQGTDVLFAAFRAAMPRYTHPGMLPAVHVRRSTLGGESSLIGAGLLIEPTSDVPRERSVDPSARVNGIPLHNT